MNKIFRIVWSQATQSWVAVSELTKAHKKQSSSNAQRSAVKFSGRFIKYSAVALTLLSGNAAYAAINAVGAGNDNAVAFGANSKATGGNSVALGTNAKAEQNNGIAIGRGAESTGDSAVALGMESKSTSQWSVAIGLQTKADNKQAVAVGSKSQATGENSIAIGNTATASKNYSVALGSETGSTHHYTTAVGGTALANQEGATALGYGARATNTNTIAIGNLAKAEKVGVIALGSTAAATGDDTIAIGNSATAKKDGDIILGKDAKSRDQGVGRSIAIGQRATAGSNRNGVVQDDKSTGQRGDDGSVAIGTNAYTGLNKGNTAVNNSVALGAGAGVGYRSVGDDGKPLGVGTDADDNDTVLVKAFGGTKSTLSNFNNSGSANTEGFFSFQNVDINEGTALGRNTRAMGDQSVAIGAQSVAGQGSIVIGGNDIQAYDGKKYFKAANPNSGDATGVNDFNAETTPGTGKNGQPITITAKYKELVGAELDRAYRASYGQDGSTVIGMQAHSTTPLGVAIGTNSIVRKGAFGATAIGSGASVVANAEAAVAIGMGAEAQGSYAVAAGTAARAKESAVAAGYQANADKSAVAVGDSSKATNSSVAVGQLAQATKEADIAVGQGAKASGNQGAIAMGLGTNAQGDSSIMIGGADIKSASAQTIKYQKATGGITSRDVTETINGTAVTRHYSFSETKEVSDTIAKAYKELTGLDMETDSINFADAKNKNGHASTSLGVHALSKGDLGTAIGASSRADAIGSVALGVGAHATKQNAVAIGTGSTTALVGTRQLSVNYDSDGKIVSDNSPDIAYTFKWAGGTNTSEGDVVSFGSSGAERQLKNVAAGRVAEDSTDAINGSQLNSITKKIAAGFNTSGNVVTGSSGEFTSKKANTDTDPAKKDYETAIRSEDKVQFQVGNNLKLDRDETVSEVEVPDDFNKNQKVKKKIRKADFAYSLNPVLTNLTSAEFKGTDANAPTTKLTNDGVKITPAKAGKNPVSLTENGLDNGGNPITNVAGNLDGAKTGTTAPTTNATKPATLNNSNAATVGDVLNAGWNLQEKGAAKDFVTAYDTVNFVDGDGTSVSVTNTDGKTSTIKYSVNTGNGLQKDPTGNTISVKPADKSLEVTNEGVKVKTADNTLTTDGNGLKVNTGNITASSVPTVADDDKDKIATVGNVADAIKAAAWKATSDATANGENSGKKDQEVKAGDTVTFEADKNIKIAQADGKFTFSTKDNVEFTTVKVGDTANGKKPVELKNGDVITANNNPEQPTTALNVSSDNKPTQITGVGSVLNTEAVPTIPAGTATTGNGQPKLVNLGTGHNQTALGNNVLNAAATVRDLASMGWVVSSDKTTDATGEYKDVVKNANEVKFVGKNAAKVSGKTDPKTGIRTITVDVEAPDVKTAELVSSKDGSIIAPSTNPELQKALKDAKDELAALPKEATPEQKEAAENKVKAAETALNNAVDNKGVATAKNVADMINASGFTLKTSATADGKKESGDDEVINPGKAVEMVAGKNLTVKQEANGKVTYSTKDEVEFNTVKLGDAKDGKAPVNMKTEAAKPATNNGADQPTTALNFTSGEGDKAKPTQLTGVGSTLNTQDIVTAPQGKDNTNKPNVSLVNLVGTDDAPVNKNAAATVGDLQNMGWVVSTKDGNGYTDVVKNANQVDFKGTGLATVTGETDKESGIRTITVNVDAQKTVEAAQTPVVYTNKDGDKLVKVGDKFYKADDVVNGKPKENAQEVPKGDVIASMNNGDNNTNKPMQLANIGSNLPTVNDTTKKAFDPNSTEPKAGKDNKSAPITAKEAADIVNKAGNNAATVSDVLNAGWNLQNNGEARDFVKPYDTVNFINGKGTVAVVETADDAASSTVKFDVDAGEITSNTNGSVNGPTTAENAKKLADDLKKAEQAVKDLPADATPEAKKAAQDALKAAQDVAAPLNKVATAQNVADMINASGFTLKADKTEGDNLTAADLANGEMINPGDTITMKAGKNMSVKHDKDGSITYATKEDVSFNTVNVGDNTYVDADGKPVTKNADGTYTDSKGQPIEEGKVTKLAPVAMKAEKAKPATNNGNKAEDQPTTALNVSSSDGKPTQITGVGSTLNVKPVDTNPNGTATTGDARPNLVDLVGTDAAPVNKNAAATVGDLQNMGWVVSTEKGNGYKDVVKNANQVDFKGENGISVTGKTNDKGVREITISVAEGKVTNDVKVTKADGKVINAVKGPDSKLYEKGQDGKPDTSKPITLAEGDKVDNEGSKFVSGNAVATAIQESGWNIGKAEAKDVTKAFEKEAKVHDKVNPNDDVKFVDGQNTVVKMVTVDAKNEDGSKKATTFVKVDVTGLPVQYTDKNGTPVTKVGDKYFTVDKDGNPTTTEVKPADLTTNMVNPAAAPNVIGAPTALGNVKSNLPSVNDADKNAKDVDGNPIAGKDNKSAPIDAAKAADIAKNAGNNAATVSDVLNAGWNLQNNGEAKDFVKPYDTVNFVDGKGTKVSVETENGTTSNVKFDIDTGKITNKSDGSVQGPVTPEMTKALEDATNALNSLPPTAPAAVIDAAKKAVADAANNIANVANKVATAQDVANAINKSGFTLTTSANGGEKISGTPEMINPGKKVEMVAGKNMTVKQESNGKVTYATASNVTFDSVQFGDKGPKITNKAGNINVSGPDGKTPTKITGVAPGEISATSKDAINGSQLHAVASNLNNKINKVGKHADAGTASALAAANIPQAYTPGKSLVGIAAGNYQGQNGLAVGMSRISDNGKIIIRLSGTANSQGKTGVAAGVGYQW